MINLVIARMWVMPVLFMALPPPILLSDVPKVSEIPAHQVEIARKDVRFNCTVGTNFSDKDWLIWYWTSPRTGNTKRIFAAQMGEDPTDGVKAHPEKYSIYGRYDLIVRDVRYEDQGTYICAIRDQVNHTASLSVVDSVRCGQRAVLVREKDEAFLWCSMRAEGTAQWDVQWQHKARKLVSGNLDVTGMIYRHLSFRARPSDSGKYTCIIESTNPLFRQQCELMLQVTPINTTAEAGVKSGETDKHDPGNTVLIVVSVVGVICVFGLTTALVIIYRRRKGASKRSPSKSSVGFRPDTFSPDKQGSPSSTNTVATGLSVYGVV